MTRGGLLVECGGEDIGGQDQGQGADLVCAGARIVMVEPVGAAVFGI